MINRQQIDLSLLADEPDIQDYNQRPVDNYGLQLLKEMGFSQARGIGKRKQNQLSDIFVLKPRPKGLGLGAQNQQQSTKEVLEIGDKVLITNEQHKGLVGCISQKHEEDNFSVQLFPSKSIVKIHLNYLKKISKSQMKTRQEQFEKQKNSQKEKKKRIKWVIPNIRVKVIDAKSKYYLKKVIVTELISNRQFQCRDENGSTITDLGENDIQTVIPKNGGVVVILKGQHKGFKATVLDRKKSKGIITVQTDEQLEILNLEEDDISQFIQF